MLDARQLEQPPPVVDFLREAPPPEQPLRLVQSAFQRKQLLHGHITTAGAPLDVLAQLPHAPLLLVLEPRLPPVMELQKALRHKNEDPGRSHSCAMQQFDPVQRCVLQKKSLKMIKMLQKQLFLQNLFLNFGQNPCFCRKFLKNCRSRNPSCRLRWSFGLETSFLISFWFGFFFSCLFVTPFFVFFLFFATFLYHFGSQFLSIFKVFFEF